MSTIDDLTEQEQRLIAADFAERVLPIFEAHYPDDDRSRKAIEAARAYARGEITKEQLSAAESAAWSAAMSTARADAGDAAWAAAWAAAGDAAGAAAWDATRAAAGDAAGGAEWGDEWYAAGGAERAWQQQRIDEVVAARVYPEGKGSVHVWDITGGVARPLVVEPGSSLDKAWDGDDTFVLEFVDTEPVVVDLDRQVFVMDDEEYEIYGTSAALGILGRALGIPDSSRAKR